MENTFLNIKLLTIINEEETLTNIFNKISADFTDGKKILLVSFDLNANTILKRFTFCLDEHEITSNSDHVKNINGKNGGCISIVDDFDVRSIDLLKRTIEKLMLDRKYDYILIDCMPSLGMITINALACSDKIIIPVQGEYLAAKGMGHLLKTVNRIHKQINPDLKIGGVLLTLVDKRTNLSKEVRNTINENYGQVVKIYDTEIPKAVNTAKSTSTGKSIFEFDKNSPVADAYKKFAKEVLDNERTRTKNEASKIR